ncbi:MAG: hypothetical protein E6G97_21660 [Alphaproteobacteria bacterium]|nr:MAG: hypothetical protein E6G97_21660 [Alphaproteobacteria bacterium]
MPDSLSDPKVIASRALQLRERERVQIATNFEADNFEIVSSFVWMRSMALLKKQLGALGNVFIGELLQRPDIDEFADIGVKVSDAEAISLARDLGILTPLQTLRLLQSQAIVLHFSGVENDSSVGAAEAMTREEAVSCLRVCVQGILGQEKIGAAEKFKEFRQKLGTVFLTEGSPEVARLRSSPYFFIKTTVSIVLALFRTSEGAEFEHVSQNGRLIIPIFWPLLKDPERWQIGRAYATEFSEGRKDVVRALHGILVSVAGFDYVPDNLRSNTFVEVANKVIAAHQGSNNFHNEPAPMRELANLGTSIPTSALATCITAVLCVRLGTGYGTSYSAQAFANEVIRGLSRDNWLYYFNERFEQDRIILAKLEWGSPLENWMKLIRALDIDPVDINSDDVRRLIAATTANDPAKVKAIARGILSTSLGDGQFASR